MAIGSILRDRDVQYIAIRDDASKTWRILDTWHEALKNFNLEDDIPDDNEAVQILTESGFTALIREAARLGVLENVDFGMDNSYEIEEKDAEIAKLKDEISKIREENIKKGDMHSDMDDSSKLKSKAMDSILKIVSLTDINELTKD